MIYHIPLHKGQHADFRTKREAEEYCLRRAEALTFHLQDETVRMREVGNAYNAMRNSIVEVTEETK